MKKVIIVIILLIGLSTFSIYAKKDKPKRPPGPCPYGWCK